MPVNEDELRGKSPKNDEGKPTEIDSMMEQPNEVNRTTNADPLDNIATNKPVRNEPVEAAVQHDAHAQHQHAHAPQYASLADIPVEVAPAEPSSSVSYPSSGSVVDRSGRIIHNGHSVLTDVGGHQVWLHAEQHTHREGRVHMPAWHAQDVGLPVPGTAKTATDQSTTDAA